MSAQIVSKADLPAIISLWVNDLQVTDVDELEITAKQDVLIIKRAQRHKSAVLETQGTIHLAPETIHEIALSHEFLYDD